MFFAQHTLSCFCCSARAQVSPSPLHVVLCQTVDRWPASCEGRHPAPIERIVAQLANEAPLVDEVVAWEWHSCLSPHGATSSTTVLYEAYKSYVLGGVDR